MKKILCFILAFAMVLPLAACSDERETDPSKTLYIGNFDGGAGSEWLEKLAKQYEDENPGYFVKIDNKKLEYNGAVLLNNIERNRQEMYFTTDVIYDDAVSKKLFADITDIVTDKSELVNGENISIEDKMEPSMANYFKRNSKYYAIPFMTAIYGTVYDKDLFEEFSLYNIRGYSSPLGPDGKDGTFDDGLPSTWEDFKLMMSVMRGKGITPFTFSYQNYYRMAWQRAMWASYEGYDNYMLNYTFDGVDSRLGKIDITNGYKVQEQDGKKAMIKASHDIISNRNNYSAKAFGSIQSNIQAQEEFLTSNVISEPVAMLMEGCWWENEAKAIFTSLAKGYGNQYAYGTRNFGYMPFPKFVGSAGITDQDSKGTTLYSDGNTSAFISAFAAPEKIAMAKKFLKMSTSNASLSEFTATTGIARPYDYQLSEEQLSRMTTFTRELWSVYNADDTKVTSSYPMSKARQAKPMEFEHWDSYSEVNKTPYAEPFFAFRDESQKVTAEQYIAGYSTIYSKTYWDKMFSLYY